jgi:hypothetical protein
MEKLPGKSLGDMFYTIPEKKHIRSILRLTQIEGDLFSVPLPVSGSVYYSKYLPPETKNTTIPERESVKGLCVGPYAN